MIVTVQETIEHSRDITAEMVEAYIVKRRWRLDYESQQYRWYDMPDTAAIPIPRSDKCRIDAVVQNILATIAKHEHRKPHEVLADIAEWR